MSTQPITVPCPTCSSTGTDTYEDRHTETRMDTCRTCGGERFIPARTGETPEASFRPHPEAALSAREAEKTAAVKAAILPELSTTETVMTSPQHLDDLKAARIARVAVAALDRLSIAPTATAGDGIERVRHVKLGTEYEVLGEAEAQVSSGSYRFWPKGSDPLGDAGCLPARLAHGGATLTVYRCATAGKLWCRFTDEFRDGRFETIAQAPAVQAPAGEDEPDHDLWCMHVHGPDELFAAPDFWTALAWAAELNACVASRAVKQEWAKDDNWPRTQAVVARWPWSAEDHAECLTKELALRAAHEARRKAASPTPTDAQPKASSPVGDEALREKIAQTLYEHDNRGLRDCWAWDADGLEAEHPGTRERYERAARAILPLVASHLTTGQETVATPRDGGVREALEFYANPDNWIDTPPWDCDPEAVTPKGIPVDRSQEYAPLDCGDRARAALAANKEMTEAPTDALVDRFAKALKGKLRASETTHGWRDGQPHAWRRNDWAQYCQWALAHHVWKGDPIDVAAFAAFCWHHGWPTYAPKAHGDRKTGAVAPTAAGSAAYRARYPGAPLSECEDWAIEAWNRVAEAALAASVSAERRETLSKTEVCVLHRIAAEVIGEKRPYTAHVIEKALRIAALSAPGSAGPGEDLVNHYRLAIARRDQHIGELRKSLTDAGLLNPSPAQEPGTGDTGKTVATPQDGGVREALAILRKANRSGLLPGCMMPDGAAPCDAFAEFDEAIRGAIAVLTPPSSVEPEKLVRYGRARDEAYAEWTSELDADVSQQRAFVAGFDYGVDEGTEKAATTARELAEVCARAKEIEAERNMALDLYNDLKATCSAPGSSGPGENAGPPTTLNVADALDAFWNAALGAERRDSSVVACIAEGVSAVASQLREISATPYPAQEPGTGDTGDAELRREVAFFVSCVKALMRHTNPTTVNEGHAQQWFAVSDAIHMKIEPLLSTTPATKAETPGTAEGAR